MLNTKINQRHWKVVLLNKKRKLKRTSYSSSIKNLLNFFFIIMQQTNYDAIDLNESTRHSKGGSLESKLQHHVPKSGWQNYIYAYNEQKNNIV